MHIALVMESLDKKRVGAVISVNRYLEWLTKAGIKITIVSTGDPAENKVVMKTFYPWYLRKALQETDLNFAIPNEKLLEETFKKVDLVHVGFPFGLGKGAVKVAKKLNKPLLLSFHVQPQNILFAIKLEKLKLMAKLMYRSFIGSVFSKADAVHCPSRFAADQLIKHGCKVPMEVISNGIPEYVSSERLQKPQHLKDKFIIFCHGRLAREKRQCDLIEAVARSRNRNSIKLIISGKGPTQDNLEKQMKEKLPEGIITYLSTEDLLATLRYSDLFVHSSLIDLESLSCLEAIGSGMVPLIADAPDSASSQFALDERSHFPVKDINTLIEKIDYWVENPEELEKMRKVYTESSKKYSAETVTKKVIEVYKRLIEEKRELHHR